MAPRYLGFLKPERAIHRAKAIFLEMPHDTEIFYGMANVRYIGGCTKIDYASGRPDNRREDKEDDDRRTESSYLFSTSSHSSWLLPGNPLFRIGLDAVQNKERSTC